MATDGRLGGKIHFDGWVLDPVSGALSKAGVTQRLQIQPLQVLSALIESPGTLVTREQLIALLWPKGVVEFDASLNTAIRKLRVALNDDAESPRYIETIPRRGYRFIATLDAPAPDPQPPALLEPPAPVVFAAAPPAPPAAPVSRIRNRMRYLIGALLLLVVVGASIALYFSRTPPPAGPASLVVLPFRDLSPQQTETAFCLALSEEIGSRLAQLPSLRIVAHSSAVGIARENLDAREVGTRLGVMYVVEGTVRREGQNLRVGVELVSTKDGYRVFSRPFNFSSENQLEVEQTLAQSVAQALRIWLTPEMIQQWEARTPHNTDALAFYARARQFGHSHTSDGDDQAAELYQLALDQDPQFALAYVGLAEMRLRSIITREIKVADVEAEVSRLLASAGKLNPNLPELFAVQGTLAREKGDLAAAEALIRKAIALRPSDALSHAKLASVYDQEGNARESLAHYTRAAELDPFDHLFHLYRCINLTEVGKFDEAARACARTRETDEASYWAPLVTSWLELARGDLVAALHWNAEAMRLAPAQASIAFGRIDLLLELGDVEEARATLARIVTTDEAWLQRTHASLELATGGRPALRAWLERNSKTLLSGSAAHVDLVRLYHSAGMIKEAREQADVVLAAPGFREIEMLDSTKVLNGYSPALVCAAAMIEGGEREAGLRLLDEFAAYLTKLEGFGWRAHGIDSLRAEVLAMRGEPDAAMQSLRRATERGWRSSFHARVDPYLVSLHGRADFKALIKEVEARNAEMRGRLH